MKREKVNVADDKTCQLLQVIEALVARLGGVTVIADEELSSLSDKSVVAVDAVAGGLLVRVGLKAVADHG